MSESQPSTSLNELPEEEFVRRAFIVEVAAVIIGGLAAVIPAIAAAAFFFTPLLKKRSQVSAGDDGFRHVGNATGLKEGGAPQFFRVLGVKKDAWTTYPSTSLGAVYVRKDEEGKYTCFNARCTHLGCTVTYRPDHSDFLCPCHASAFNLEGERSNQIPPRNLDTLEVEVRDDNQVWVKFENFRAGREAKIPV